MRNLLIVFACSLFLYGCGGSSDKTSENSSETVSSDISNIEISLGSNKWGMSLPKTWEKMKAFPNKGIIFLAREGTQNIAISNEKGFTENISERLLKTLQESLSMVEVVSQEGDGMIFRGKLTSTTPMREFHQKILAGPNKNKFLLVSCSQEVANLDKMNCPEILSSIQLAGELE